MLAELLYENFMSVFLITALALVFLGGALQSHFEAKGRVTKDKLTNEQVTNENEEATTALDDQELATWALAQIDGGIAIRKLEELPCGGFLVTYFNSDSKQLVAVIPARPPAPKAIPIQVAA